MEIAALLTQLIDLLLHFREALTRMSAAALGHPLPPKPIHLSPVALAGLATVLADLYPDPANLRRLLAWAQLDAKLVPLDDAAVNRWHFAVTHAQAQGQLGLLVRLALEEYPHHTELTYYADHLNPPNPEAADAQ